MTDEKEYDNPNGCMVQIDENSITGLLSKLNAGIHEVENTVEVLITRITPIMGDSKTKLSGSEECPREASGCDLVEDLKTKVFYIKTLNSLLTETIDRIEL